MLSLNKLVACAAVSLVAALTGCSGSGAKTGDGAAVPTSTGNGGITTSGTGYQGVGGNGTDASQLAQHTVYFDFDSSEIKPEGEAVIAAWARYLTANPTAKARLEGNTDERGTREYNIALGERRGQSVARALQAAGVSPSQLSVTSYGEERPVALGHDEASWSQNRRVELVNQ
jgi:peptidoglycan-associated lipoprotein